ncbi:class A beta-lactamase [Mycobacterium spongiae]|uniref:Beta-lactamase n=1 Tax=Mycobacterium spongiae TaxID=886343 RepID=A0A975JY90_9MYCO|nr:class A beta-lactamase [Mycobacterium spongiae]QUR67906.1 class A beta-lactamase [Mycobacterium spongiae]
MRTPGLNGFGRRELLAASLVVSLAACTRPARSDAPVSTTALARPKLADRFADLEREFEARLGVDVVAADATATIAYRADERFAFCSTFKAPLAAAVLHKNSLAQLDTVIAYTTDDIRSASPVTQQHVETGMTIGQLCDAAIRYSDGTAANLLLNELAGTTSGPAAFTGYLRSLGDTVSRLDQEEPELNRNPPGDQRDTTTPRAIALVFRQLVLGDALAPDKRALLIDWLARSTTGAKRIRAGFPADWKVVDKTGSGDYGRANDVAVVWSPSGVPHVVAIMSDRADGGYDAKWSDDLVAAAATCVAGVLS